MMELIIDVWKIVSVVIGGIYRHTIDCNCFS